MAGANEMSEFGEFWKETKNFNANSLGNYIFRASIIYESKKKGMVAQECSVQFTRNGYDDGKIEIFANGRLQSETHHLAFHHKWQTYQFIAGNGDFIIEANSEKMGAYRIIISPNGGSPSYSD